MGPFPFANRVNGYVSQNCDTQGLHTRSTRQVVQRGGGSPHTVRGAAVMYIVHNRLHLLCVCAGVGASHTPGGQVSCLPPIKCTWMWYTDWQPCGPSLITIRYPLFAMFSLSATSFATYSRWPKISLWRSSACREPQGDAIRRTTTIIHMRQGALTDLGKGGQAVLHFRDDQHVCRRGGRDIAEGVRQIILIHLCGRNLHERNTWKQQPRPRAQ